MKIWHFLFWFILQWVWADGLSIQREATLASTQSFTRFAAHDEQVPVCSSSVLGSNSIRFGEADHPGPGTLLDDLDDFQYLPPASETLRIGCSNPSGLKGKEHIAMGLGTGIWCYSETHLTLPMQRTTTAICSHLGRNLNRQVRAHFGAPVAYRSNSDHAGTWAGVGILSDFASREIALAWQHGERSSGRLLVTRHMVHNLSFLVVACYGFPAGPTWPNSRQLTQQLLSSLTRDVVIGGAGPRIIAGDYNCSATQLEEFQIWERYGWVEVQHHAQRCWQRTPVPTCKQATTVDMIWMSPEAARLCTNVGDVDMFAEHTTIFADFHIPNKISNIWTWPKPSPLDWDKIDVTKWHAQVAQQPPLVAEGLTSTQHFSVWAHRWESALDGCIKEQPEGKLPDRCKGRAQRVKPELVPPVPPVAKASRPGEVQLRSDLISTQVQLWFKQLRRLQSFKHAALANKLTLDAEAYRLNLWTAIKRGRGFDSLFATWWIRRKWRSFSAPALFPDFPPDGPTSEAIFNDFKHNFEMFERWHLRQRRKQLQLKYDHSCHQLFRELKPHKRDQLDLLWHTQDYTILAIDPQGNQLHVDQQPQEHSGCVWFINNIQIEVLEINDDVLALRSLPDALEAGDLLQCHRYYSGVQQVQQALLELWQPRWQRASQVGSDQWARIVGFVQAYMPRFNFAAPALTLEGWKKALDHFPTRPARGVDGIDVADLKHLPDSTTMELMDLLRSIGSQRTTWPDQLLFGTVLSLGKQDHPHLPNHFRPVVILGTVYRAWSRMCALPLLQMLAQLVPSAAHGFLPGRECAQVWMQLQGYIELCQQQHLSFSGFSTDIEKCFNNVGRDPLMMLAQHLGLPDELLLPWRSFLDNFVRSFQVQTALSTAVHSTQGLPEGCSLSVAGMVLIDWAFHVYLSALAPSVHAFSYVDNISEAGHVVMEVVSAFFSTLCFFQLWGLTLDFGKSYFWSTSSTDRALLRLLGLSLRGDALELGGSMTFEATRRNRQLKARGEQLQPKWERLKRSLAPRAQKLQILPMAFWSAALHGSASCPLSDGYFHQLRQAANKALRCNQAGSCALLRFSLSDNMDADPGFYHVISVAQTFRRVCGRTPKILDCWRLWMASYDGQITHGPFGVLLNTMNKIGWSISYPPMIADCHGMEFDLLLTPWAMLRHLLEDAWLCYVTTTLSRPSMQSLEGIDVYVTKWNNGNLTALERSLQSSLQSGAFVDAWTHGKYDVTKDVWCKFCSCPLNHEHLLVCPQYSDLREQFLLQDNLDLIPRALAMHLLCPRSPWINALRSYFANLVDTTDQFLSGPADSRQQHLFTDGSHKQDGRHETKRAAWGLYNANSQRPVAAGWLAGLPQTIARAELTAVISAIKWSLLWQTSVHIWLDALEIHRGLQRRLAFATTRVDEVNADLWYVVDTLLQDGARTWVTSAWIPSHLQPELCESPFEECIAYNNGHADSLAVRCNEDRPQAFRELLALQRRWDARHVDLFDRLRKYYFAVFERTKAVKKSTVVMNIDSSDAESNCRLYSFLDVLSTDINPEQFVHTLGYPVAFLQALLDWLRNHESDEQIAVSVSFLEVTFAVLKVSPTQFPFRNPTSGVWVMQDRRSMFERPTLTHFYRVICKVFRYLCRNWCDGFPLRRGLDRSLQGVTIPLEGIFLRLRPSVLAAVHDHLASFTSTRPIRRAGDMARPVA